jgi:phosphatidate phosphatase APP1
LPWQVFGDSLRRVTAPPIPDARLRIEVGGRVHRVGCSVHGYFDAWLEPGEPLEDSRLWHLVDLQLEGADPAAGQAEILTPIPGARFAVISDIDDTVVPTRATSFFRMLYNTFFKDARARPTFPGVGGFYRALHAGSAGDEANPVLYVSRGPWSLYEVLSEMLRRHALPDGPVLFLRKWGLSREGLERASPQGHKYREIVAVLAAFRDLPLILIGDSGQRDPEIYAEVVRQHPGRVLVSYIRTVEPSTGRRGALKRLALEVAHAGSELVLAEDTLAMAEHAAERGLIARSAVPDVAAERRQDAATSPTSWSTL